MAKLQVGAYVSSSGGLFNTIGRAEAIEAEALMTFGSSNRAWRKTEHSPEAIAQFRALHAASSVGEIWLHNIYLANLATEDPELLEKSIDCVVHALTLTDAIGAQGVVLHTGSRKERSMDEVLPQVRDAITRILQESPGEAVLALENAAGQGGVIGKDFAELGAIVRAVDSPRLQVCFDTCHAFAAGYDVTDPKALRDAVREFDAEVGLDRLAVLHANDSKMELGGHRDRHENIGDGYIGEDGFRVLLAEPAFHGKTWLLEVPGIDGDGPDLENVRRLKRLRDEVAT